MNSFIGIVFVVVLIAVSLISISFTVAHLIGWIYRKVTHKDDFDVLVFFEDKEKDR
jgi:hypothetical protein